MIKRTTGKICLVTGGNRGIGAGIVRHLAQQGYNVALTFKVNAEQANRIEAELIQTGLSVKAFQMDHTNRIEVKKVISSVEDHFSNSVEVLVNNAAIAQEKPFETITDEDWENMLRVNLQGPFICVQEILGKMLTNRWGRIINITSIGGQWGGYNQVHYAAAKAALINFTRSIAKIYSQHNITSNAIAVGLVATEMSQAELESDAGQNKVAGIPIGRIAKVEEIAAAVGFLISPEASYITGQTINLNGGMYFG